MDVHVLLRAGVKAWLSISSLSVHTLTLEDAVAQCLLKPRKIKDHHNAAIISKLCKEKQKAGNTLSGALRV